MIFLDANIFLEFELGDKYSQDCKTLLSKIHNNKIKAITSDFIVYTCLIQMENKLKSVEKMENFITFLENLIGLEIHSPTYKIIYNAFEIMKKYKLDFDDALVVSIMKSLGIKQLVSFDKDFDKANLIIRRIEPKEIIENF